ncbi:MULTISPECIES: hypothetical protein [unclassified Gilliamella]|uniref:hypothetical protein n=1 Tax=unclassified Gilliamella TaxID=2685620 RepID=UPI001308ABCA|nr:MULTISPECIES: hypothetical protein [unclassified Gilliamella]MWP50301.1 hypothetical protein [Gilliamella sp. Lep-s35]MWP70015.1 hypothetical protein [Gilliamella sp. Lep-s5]MWP78252.1 hypothetical protein [Gilliamella sp. Lep-s21]
MKKNISTNSFSFLSHKHLSPNDFNQYKKYITQLVALKQELSELDPASKAFSDKYAELGLAFYEVLKYSLNGEYQLDDFVKLPELMNNLDTAYNQYIEAQNIALANYHKLYDEIHQFQTPGLKHEVQF